MAPFLFLYSALVGFFAFAAIYHLILWWTSRREPLLGVFSLDCLARSALSAVLVAIATSTTTAEAQAALRVRIALGFVVTATALWSYSLVSGVRARWFVWPMTAALLTLLAVHTAVVPLNSAVTSLAQLTLPWGERITQPDFAKPGWWLGPLYALVISSHVFGLYCGWRLWARDRMASTLILCATTGTLVILALDAMRSFHTAVVPFIGVVPQVLWVSVIALLIAREHRRTREQLAASEHRFRGIFDQTFQFIGLMRTDGTLIEANRTALEFAGVREADVIGKLFWETPWWAHSPELQSRLREATLAARAGHTVRFEATHPRPDGRLAHVDFSLKPVANEHGEVTMLIPEGRDITDRKEAEEHKRVLEAKLAQSQKMEAIGQLAGGVAHDFNNLLTVINGYGELLQTTMRPDDRRHAMLEGIVDAGKRAASLNRQLLTFSRWQLVDLRVLDVNAVVAEADRMLRRLIGEDIRLLIALDPTLALVKADAGQIGQVIMNLVVNARDAMPTGGTLTIETANTEIDGTLSTGHPDAVPGHYATLTVTDTGVGMAPEILGRIFEPFFTTKSPGKGTGLGLATVRAIVDGSEGLVQVHSEPGHGSTFRLFFPALPATTIVERPVARDKTPHGDETILLVEDEEAVRCLTRQILEQFGYTVLEASGGADAIRLVAAHTERIDLVVADVVMPEMGGRQLVEHLALTRPGLRVLYLSGYPDDDVVRHGVLESEMAFLQKPFTMDALAIKVRQTLDAVTPQSDKQHRP